MRFGFDHAPEDEVVPVDPTVMTAWAGADESLPAAPEQQPVAAGHEQSVGYGGAVARVRPGADEPLVEVRQLQDRRRPTPVHVTHGEAHQDMWRAIVGLDLVGIEMLIGRILILQPLWLGEMQRVLRGGGHDGPHALGEAAVILTVDLRHRVPEHQVL